MNAACDAIRKTLCFHRAWRYAPTLPELFSTLETTTPISEQDFSAALRGLENEGWVRQGRGRVGLAENFDEIVAEIARRDALQAAKRRRARRFAFWLKFLGARFVALSNTTALGNARRDGDLDFFVVVRRGALWSTRFLSAGLFRLLGLLPSQKHARDTACLSYFVTDDALDLSAHLLAPDDPYFRHWFLSLLPLYDDGVSQDLWRANPKITSRHAMARPWIAPPDLRLAFGYRLPSGRMACAPTLYRLLESPSRAFQLRWFPPGIKQLMNRDTRVVVNEQTLKLHVNDRREEYRRAYEALISKVTL
ncbi:MAG: hypothetical protein WC641_03245 [Patescibacteria group bacterium]